MPRENIHYKAIDRTAQQQAFKALISEILENAESYPEITPVVENRLGELVGSQRARLFCKSISEAAHLLRGMEITIDHG
jgi:hypothetical protein